MSYERGSAPVPTPLAPPRAGGLGGERGNHRGIAPTRFHNSFRLAILDFESIKSH